MYIRAIRAHICVKRIMALGLLLPLTACALLVLPSCRQSMEKKAAVLNWAFPCIFEIGGEKLDAEAAQKDIEACVNAALRARGKTYQVKCSLYGLEKDDFQERADAIWAEHAGEPDSVKYQLLDDSSVELDRSSLELEAALKRQADLDVITFIRGPWVSGPYYPWDPYLKALKSKSLLDLTDALAGEQGRELVQKLGRRTLEQGAWQHRAYGIPYRQASGLNAGLSYAEEAIEALHLDKAALPGDILVLEPILKMWDDPEDPPLYASPLDLLYEQAPIEARLQDIWNVALFTDGQFHLIFEEPSYRAYLKTLASWKKDGLLRVARYRNDQERPMRRLLVVPTGLRAEEAKAGEIHNSMYRTASYDVPNLKHAIQTETYTSNLTAVLAASERPDEAFDFLCALSLDEKLRDDLSTLGKKVPKGGSRPLSDFLMPLLSFVKLPAEFRPSAGVVEAAGRAGLDGFRFDPSGLETEIRAVNKIIGYGAGNDESLYPGAARRVAMMEEPMEANLDQLTQDLKAAGADRIVAEANRQLALWRASAPQAEKGGGAS